MKSINRPIGFPLILGFAILVIPEILKVYLIMPLPGSQHQNHVELAYAINKFIWVSRVVGGLLFIAAAVEIYRTGKIWKKAVTGIMAALAVAIIYLTTYVMLADKIFYQPKTKLLAPVSSNKIDDARLVIAVEHNGEAKAYPIYLLGYHHQVRDTVGGEPVMVTYCTVCRTGRVYKPEVNGKPETFRLVGMDQFNAMFEDATTKSWWRQATGVCCAGPLKGQRLQEIPSNQSTLASWKLLYPQTLIMQPDAEFAAAYKGLIGYDVGTLKGGLEGTDTIAFHPKWWVLGVVTANAEKMYDWNVLKNKKVLNDEVGGTPVVVVVENDLQSFHTFSRKVNDSVAEFVMDNQTNLLHDKATNSTWNMKGECVEGSLKGAHLIDVQSHQEFYHSFLSFHPGAAVYK